MKDLYLQLGINPEASQSDIEAAFRQHPELEDTAAILLNESRRTAYSRTVSTLRSIGMLRHRLGLDAENSWFVERCPDFAPRLHIKKYVTRPQPVAAGETAAPATTGNAPEKAGGNKTRPWLKVLMTGLVIAAVLLLLNAYL